MEKEITTMEMEMRYLNEKVKARVKYLEGDLESKKKELEAYKVGSAERLKDEDMDTIARKAWIYKETKAEMEKEIIIAEAKLYEAGRMAFHLENLLREDV